MAVAKTRETKGRAVDVQPPGSSPGSREDRSAPKLKAPCNCPMTLLCMMDLGYKEMYALRTKLHR
jgi:hypothetical protein